MLNLFQHPPLIRADRLVTQWILKQVQDDGKKDGAALVQPSAQSGNRLVDQCLVRPRIVAYGDKPRGGGGGG